MKRIKKKKRIIKLNPEMLDALRKQRERFRQKFGRDPGPNDPVFFDPDSDVPAPMSEDYIKRETVTAMTEAGISPVAIYAYRRTGLIVSEENYARLSPEERAEWNAAVEEYLKGHEKADHD
jgi:integrase